MKIVVVSAGLGQPSSTQMLGERLGQATGADEVRHVELRLLAHDLVNALLTHVNSPALQVALDEVTGADGLVVVSPIYNATMSGLFKMFFEVLEEGALLGKPVLLGATGGTARHSLAIDQAMLPLFFYLKAVVIPTSVFAATDDWGDDSGLVRRIDRAGRELAAMVGGRQASVNELASVDVEDAKAVDGDVESVGDLHLTMDFAQLMGNI